MQAASDPIINASVKADDTKVGNVGTVVTTSAVVAGVAEIGSLDDKGNGKSASVAGSILSPRMIQNWV